MLIIVAHLHQACIIFYFGGKRVHKRSKTGEMTQFVLSFIAIIHCVLFLCLGGGTGGVVFFCSFFGGGGGRGDPRVSPRCINP